jgi:hypothetical protein
MGAVPRDHVRDRFFQWTKDQSEFPLALSLAELRQLLLHDCPKHPGHELFCAEPMRLRTGLATRSGFQH